MSGFLRQLATFRATAATARERAGALARFGGFFADQLSQVYLRPVRPMPPPPWLAVPRPAAAPALENGASGQNRRGLGITSRAAARR